MKCVCFQEELQFLRHAVNATGLHPLQVKGEAITATPPLVTVQQLERFLGMANFYRRFMPAATCIMKPLTLSKAAPKLKI